MYLVEIKKSFTGMVEVNLTINQIIPIDDLMNKTVDFNKMPQEADIAIKFKCDSLEEGLFDSENEIEYEEIFPKLLHKLLDMKKVNLGSKDKRKITLDYRLE